MARRDVPIDRLLRPPVACKGAKDLGRKRRPHRRHTHPPAVVRGGPRIRRIPVKSAHMDGLGPFAKASATSEHEDSGELSRLDVRAENAGQFPRARENIIDIAQGSAHRSLLRATIRLVEGAPQCPNHPGRRPTSVSFWIDSDRLALRAALQVLLPQTDKLFSFAGACFAKLSNVVPERKGGGRGKIRRARIGRYRGALWQPGCRLAPTRGRCGQLGSADLPTYSHLLGAVPTGSFWPRPQRKPGNHVAERLQSIRRFRLPNAVRAIRGQGRAKRLRWRGRPREPRLRLVGAKLERVEQWRLGAATQRRMGPTADGKKPGAMAGPNGWLNW